MMSYRGLSKEETENGTITGFIIYKKLEMNRLSKKTKIAIWSRNKKMLNLEIWRNIKGYNVVKSYFKDLTDDDQLLFIAQEILGG
jgi:hypothetical protein